MVRKLNKRAQRRENVRLLGENYRPMTTRQIERSIAHDKNEFEARKSRGAKLGKFSKKALIKEIQRFMSGEIDWEYMEIEISGKRSFKIIRFDNGGSEFTNNLRIWNSHEKVSLKEITEKLNQEIERRI